MGTGGAAGLALLVAACGLVPAPIPDGYAFPTWSTGNGGAAALMEGALVEHEGCLYVLPPLGPRYLVVWPDTLRLMVDGEGVPIVLDGSRVVARVGGTVRLGGGEISPPLVPETASGCDTTTTWGTNSLLPPS